MSISAKTTLKVWRLLSQCFFSRTTDDKIIDYVTIFFKVFNNNINFLFILFIVSSLSIIIVRFECILLYLYQ